MEKTTIDHGQQFDFGKTSSAYAKFRDIYPDELYTRLYSLGIGKAGTNWLDLGTGTGIIPRKLAPYGAKILATDISFEQIAQAIALSKPFENIQYQVCSAEDIDEPENSFDVITACQCFWYFDPKRIVPKIKKMLKSGGLFLKVYMSYLKDDPIAQQSHRLVKELNPKWSGGSVAFDDLRTHYFENPKMESFTVDLPFTRESWHGRIMASRGVLASMNESQIKKFDEQHRHLLEQFPNDFSVKHKVFLTYYFIEK